MRTIANIFRLKGKLINRVQLYFGESQEKQPCSNLYNPYTKELVSTKRYLQKDQLFTKLTMAAVSFKKWKEVPLNDRVDLVKKFVNQILSDRQILKPIIAQEIGKSYKNIDEEFRRIERIADKLIETGRTSLKSQIIQEQAHKFKSVSYEPVGLSLIFPYFSEPIFDSLINLIPCLISGNGALLKCSDFNHFLGEYLEKTAKKIFGRSALVADIFIEPADLTDLAQFRTIKKVLFSGSIDSARSIFQILIERRFIDCNLFFGGKDAAYVDQTADLQLAAKQIANNCFYNNGQSYDCIKRLYLHPQIQDKFIQILVNQINQLKIGNPQQNSNDLGPLCVTENASLAQQLVNESVSQGATCMTGGLITSDGQGNAVFFEPTLITNCTNDMAIVQTQINAPILCAIPLQNQSWLDQINYNDFGTGLRIFSKDQKRYDEIIKKLQLGKISFNSGSLFDRNLPIEGWKLSGKGKLLSQLSFEEFSIPKSYNIKEL